MDVNIKLSESDRLSFRDVLFHAFNLWDVTDDVVDSYWNKIPMHLKLDAAKWGVSDTVVRENIYVFLVDNNKS